VTEGSTQTVTMHHLYEYIQTVTLMVLAFTAGAILWQAIEGRRAAKASLRLAQLSLKQTELIQTQVHASFRPIVTVTDGQYGPGISTLTLKNVGTGPALTIFGLYRSGARWSVGSLPVDQTVTFRFDNMLNLPPAPIGFVGSGNQPPIEPSRTVTLRLEYQSVTGANCWSTILFPLGRTGSVEVEEIKFGIDLPSLTDKL
jgi:hypothetical protein